MTPQSPPDPPARRLSELDSTRALRRAVEIDAQRGATLDIEDLRQIAIEAGISSDALDRAIEEVRLGTIPEEASSQMRAAGPPPRIDAVLDRFGASATTLRNWWRTTSIAIAGFGLGVAGPLLEGERAVRVRGGGFMVVNGDGMSWSIVAGIIAGLIGLTAIRRHRRTSTQWDYQMDVLWLCLAFGSGWLLAHGRFDDDPMALFFFAWSTFAAVGGLIVQRPWARLRGWVRSLRRAKRFPEHA